VQYRFALCQAKAAVRIRPDDARFQTALGAAEYRNARYAKARAALTQIGSLSPTGVAFLALTQCRLGQYEQARAILDSLREASAKSEGIKDGTIEGLLGELHVLLTGSSGRGG
jgi:Flp pilus assembly protein TadD